MDKRIAQIVHARIKGALHLIPDVNHYIDPSVSDVYLSTPTLQPQDTPAIIALLGYHYLSATAVWPEQPSVQMCTPRGAMITASAFSTRELVGLHCWHNQAEVQQILRSRDVHPLGDPTTGDRWWPFDAILALIGAELDAAAPADDWVRGRLHRHPVGV